MLLFVPLEIDTAGYHVTGTRLSYLSSLSAFGTQRVLVLGRLSCNATNSVELTQQQLHHNPSVSVSGPALPRNRSGTRNNIGGHNILTSEEFQNEPYCLCLKQTSTKSSDLFNPRRIKRSASSALPRDKSSIDSVP